MTIPLIRLPQPTLDDHIAEGRKEMGEERWQALNTEWEPEEKPVPRTMGEHVADARKRMGETRWQALNDEWEQPQ